MNTFVFGEVLWDILPDKKVIGGAPFNFAAHLEQLGNHSLLISAVGDDALAKETRMAVAARGVDTRYIGTADRPTGYCNVTFDGENPIYALAEDVAYDHITVSEEDVDKIAKTPRRNLYFGSLAQRSRTSYKALSLLISRVSWDNIFFDINLREPYIQADTIREGMYYCTVLKISRGECDMLERLHLASVQRNNYGSENKFFEALCRDLCALYKIKTVLITLDKDGAMAYDAADGRVYYAKSEPTEVVSAVGAGDGSFAAFAHFKMLDQSTDRALAKAVAVGSYVVGQKESIPAYSDELCIKLIRK